jgi:putative PIN family toxin of toxin-antitoxin system
VTLRLVLDTNVWLDWLVFDDASIKPIQNLVEAGKAEIIIDPECDAELVRVLAYPLQKWTLDSEARTDCIRRFRIVARRVIAAPAGILPECRDPDDQKFLLLAAGCEAYCLITKDRALLKLARRRYDLPFHIVTPAKFPQLPGVESVQ